MTVPEGASDGDETPATSQEEPAQSQRLGRPRRARRRSRLGGAEDQRSRSLRRSRRARGRPRKPRPRRRRARSPPQAAQQLLELTGKAAEGVTGLERTDDGWKVQVEVVEVRRIPDTTDVLALYEVDTDERRRAPGLPRLRRYARGAPRED